MTASNAPQTLDDVANLFLEARGDAADQEWARRAAGRFALDGVQVALAHDALTSIVPILIESQEPAAELFGEPRAWARECQESWRADGIPALEPPQQVSVRSIAHDTFFGASVFAVLSTIVLIVDDGWIVDITWSFVLIPLILALPIVLTRALWNRLGNSSRGLQIAAVAIFMAACAVGAAGAIDLGKEPILWEQSSAFWMLAVATLYGLAATVVGRIWPADVVVDPDVTSDDEWLTLLKTHLRAREDRSETSIRTIAQEAARHAAESGHSLQQEFGSPASYAARFAPDMAAHNRRSAWIWTVFAAVPMALAVIHGFNNGWAWDGEITRHMVWATISAIMAADGWRRVHAGQNTKD
ncbi:MAG: hypothetical protein QM705_02790 [Ancrocorticia sp.]